MINELDRAIEDYKKNPFSPEAVTNYWRKKLPDVYIPDCDWTVSEICAPMQDLQGEDIPAVVVPVTDEITLPLLGKRFPSLISRTVRGEMQVIDTHNTKGWVKVYSSIVPPNRHVPLEKAEEFATLQGYLWGREITYILDGLAVKDLTNYYLDEGGTWSWLRGSLMDHGIVIICFLPIGNVVVDSSFDRSTPSKRGGWRFEEAKKTKMATNGLERL